MIHRFLLCTFLFTLVASAQPAELNAGSNHDRTGAIWDWSFDVEEGGGSSYLGVDIADVSPERLGELKLKEEHGAEVTMVDQDAPAGKAGLHEHDVIVSLNGTAVESAAQLRRMIKETPPGRVVNLGISRDGQPLTIKVQLADRHKSTGWGQNGKFEMPQMPKMPDLPDFEVPVSVVIVHSSARSGLMVENITPQLGEFFGVKGGNGVLVRSVEKGSRGEKAGFRAGDVVVKVDNQAVHDASDFTHALRSSSGSSASVTVMREKKEQTLTLPLPAKKDSGSLQEDSFDCPEFSAETFNAATEQALKTAGEVLARVGPSTMRKAQRALRSRDMDLKDLDKELQHFQQKMQERQQEMRDRQEMQCHELSGECAEI
jgi:membrane-associated protease RseP (regulator of RpoE activity)